MIVAGYRFQPKWVPSLATFLLLPVLLSLGSWQMQRAEDKQSQLALMRAREQMAPLTLGAASLDPQQVRFRKAQVLGRYEPERQFLLDNQTHGEDYTTMAGYHVITPLRIEGSNMRILINRGWVPLGPDRAHPPRFDTPVGLVEINGMLSAPPPQFRYMESAVQQGQQWPLVWQNLDMRRYAAAVSFPVQPVVVLLDMQSKAGGFVREWPSAEARLTSYRPGVRIATHESYALQWYGMALALLVAYLWINLEKVAVREIHAEVVE